MTKDQLASEIQGMVGKCMILEAEAREMGEAKVEMWLGAAREGLVAAARLVEPELEVKR